MQRLTAAVLVPALLASASASSQQAGDTVTVRPVKEPTAELDRQIALGARPMSLSPATYPDAADLNATTVIRALCGEVRQPYVEVLEQTNWQTLERTFGTTRLPMDTRLGPAAYEISWPACLIVDTQPAQQTVSRGRPPDIIYRDLTGDRGSRSAVGSFFGMPYAQLMRMEPGVRLNPARVTLPVDLVIERPELAVTIDVLRDKAARASDPPARIVEAATEAQGAAAPSLIIGTGALAALQTPKECLDALPPPPPKANGKPSPEQIRRTRIVAALGRTRDRMRAENRGQLATQVMVVDNGFLGAVKSGGVVAARPGFAASFQARQFNGNVGPPLTSTAAWSSRSSIRQRRGPTWPDTARTSRGSRGAVPNCSPGSSRSSRRGAGSQLTVAMVNVGAGRRELLPGSAEALRRLTGLSSFRIWNFSLEYPDTSNRVIHTAFTNFFKEKSAHLYVAAAGNDGQPVGNRYPAAFGGQGILNVITVGATLPDGTLAGFSAWGSQVDIAAPGCDVQSTIDEAAHVRGMTGTSQAAPQVSLAAALLRIFGTLDAPQIKTRLIVSGALIRQPPASAGSTRQPGMVWSRSTLDVERAVDLLEDFVELADGRQYVGTVDAVTGATCAGQGFATPVDGGDLWSFKSDGTGAWIFTGRNANALPAPPCSWTKGSGTLAFIPTARVYDDSYRPLAPDDPALAGGEARLDVPLGDVARLILSFDTDNL